MNVNICVCGQRLTGLLKLKLGFSNSMAKYEAYKYHILFT